MVPMESLQMSNGYMYVYIIITHLFNIQRQVITSLVLGRSDPKLVERKVCAEARRRGLWFGLAGF